MSEHSINLSGDEVRAILADGKAALRRPVVPQPRRVGNWWVYADSNRPLRLIGGQVASILRTNDVPYLKTVCALNCKYRRGGQLWVRECWQESSRWHPPPRVFYRADGEHQLIGHWDCYDGRRWRYTDGLGGCDDWMPDSRWQSSMHMPRSASRIALQAKSVRVEQETPQSWSWVLDVERAKP